MNDLAEAFITEQQSIGEERGLRKGLEQGIVRGRREDVLRMYNRGFSKEQIADILEIEPELVEEWLKQN